MIPVFIGGTTMIASNRLLAIIDWKYFLEGENKAFLDSFRERNRLFDITDGGTPKSLVITADELYISSISSLTLKKRSDRMKKGIYEFNCVEED
ncbi:MAG: extracellular matrix regulator RemB [Anaerovibrio sp.]